MGGNQATTVNPNFLNGKHVDIAITVRGSDWLWAVTTIMGLTAVIIMGMSYRVPRTHRIFHYITAALNAVACLAYFTMASNLGWAPIDVEFHRHGKVSGMNREIFYVRYVDWFITTSLLLLDLLLTAGLPWPTITWVIFWDIVMIITGLVGALVKSTYKWGYYTFGCVAFFFVGYNLLWTARRHAAPLGADVARCYNTGGTWLLFIWCLYPIAWGLCEGGNVISSDSEAVFYGILDICAKPVFSLILLFLHRGIDPARLGLRLRDYDDPILGCNANGPGAHSEKAVTNGHSHHTNGAINGFTNGHTTDTTDTAVGSTGGTGQREPIPGETLEQPMTAGATHPVGQETTFV